MTELEALHWVLENKLNINHFGNGIAIVRDSNEAPILAWGPTFLDAVIMAKEMSEAKAA